MMFRNPMIRLAMMALLLLSLTVMALGCGDANRADCKSSCEKIYDCDDPDNGGSGVLDDTWLLSCKSACEEADEIAEDVADCILKTNCEDIERECGAGSV